mmetsp:Transcript_7031/g.11065  ORF Transcript_7031/g.11065 Transcript_7031/m.11065 type:complete len:354 (-) Transcript_7031:152-1213(-)|eukprot:CAMPEP_0184290078 /NCGR_PEP_ID=MMETSP1049-20130417/2420_1 /TAXON_ID=77928 /ORGANISM="Proteomonas sulcata, Strain CCMP704" /LENGTH=353 /DNA_ID=CAMNT_0026597123 /DNA_START=155 /DNA_END=1216 /DNA_ORIENTATION=-
MRRSLLSAAAVALVAYTEGFSVSPAGLRPSGLATCQSNRALCSQRPAVLALRAQADEVPEGFKAFTAGEKTLEQWIGQFSDERPSIRSMASMKVAEMYDEDGKGEEVIMRLMKMLTIEDVHERRSAVQALGMIGAVTMDPIIDLLLTTEDQVVRASCAKAIGAVALKNPELLPEFPQSALDGMKKAILEIPDPVTKIATVSTLGQIGGGDTRHGYPGCERALDVLVAALEVTDDMGLAAAAVNAVATIGQSNPPFRPKAVACLEALLERSSEVDGFMFVEQMIKSQLENLQGGGIVGELNKRSSGGENTDALNSLKKQFSGAQKGGFMGDSSAPPAKKAAAPPAPDDDWMSAM